MHYKKKKRPKRMGRVTVLHEIITFGYCSFSFKLNSCKTLLFRELSLSLNWAKFHEEDSFLRNYFIQYCYPSHLFGHCSFSFKLNSCKTLLFKAFSLSSNWYRFIYIYIYLLEMIELPMAGSVKAPHSQAHSVWVLAVRTRYQLSGIQVFGISLLEYHCRVKWFLIVNDLSCCDFHFI